METITRIRKQGNSFVVTIPKKLIDFKLIDPRKSVKIKIEQDDTSVVVPAILDTETFGSHSNLKMIDALI